MASSPTTAKCKLANNSKLWGYEEGCALSGCGHLCALSGCGHLCINASPQATDTFGRTPGLRVLPRPAGPPPVCGERWPLLMRTGCSADATPSSCHGCTA